MTGNKWEGKKVAFLGDSITFGSGSEIRFSDIVGEKLGFSKVYNYGHSGSKITMVAPRDLSFVNRFQDMADDADLVFVMGGTNDYGHAFASIAVPFGNFSDRLKTTFQGALHILFQGLIKKYLGKKIVILIPPHRSGFNSLDDITPNPETGKNFPDYLNAIRQTAEYYGLPILDLYRNLPLNPILPEIRAKYIPDALHPNEEGHRLIAEAIINFLKYN
ncbi:MAG: SGNH/GDSL hydrolase family protein [Bacilli bacterium]|jgi:lysophospholipase L1-like esterase